MLLKTRQRARPVLEQHQINVSVIEMKAGGYLRDFNCFRPEMQAGSLCSYVKCFLFGPFFF
jgi:hypothetical protein